MISIKKNIQIYWNNTLEVKSLLFSEFINGYDNISEFPNSNICTNSSVNGILISCELNHNKNEEKINLQNLYGIEIAKKLRLNGCKLPIIFTSFLSRKQVYNNNPERSIISSIGHKFVRLPVDFKVFEEEFSKMRPLTDSELRDVQITACNPEGIVNSKIHQISGISNKLIHEGPKAAKDELLNCLIEIHKAYSKNPDEVIADFNIKFHNLSNDNIDNAFTYVNTIGKHLIAKYSNSKVNLSLDGEYLKKPWKLLLLDDELTKESPLISTLNKMGVETICTSNADDAMKALTVDNDLRGKISVILTDYRLYKPIADDGIIEQQDTQGYTFLQEVGKRFHSRILAGIVYSGLPRQFLLETYGSYKIRPEIYSKIDFKLNDAGAINYLSSRIIEIGDSNYDALLALPLGNASWVQNLHEYYVLYRNQTNYLTRERDICDECTLWVNTYMNGEVPPSPMIKGEEFTPKRIKDELDIPETLKRFEAYYKTRRLAQFLKIFLENRKVKDYKSRIAEHLMVKTKKRTVGSIKQFFSTALGLSLDEFPFGATIEELCWFEYDLGYKVLGNYQTYRNMLLKSEQLIGDYISNIDKLVNILLEGDFKYGDKKADPEFKKEINKKVKTDRILSFNSKTMNPYIFDKTDFKLSLQFINSNLSLLNENEVTRLIELTQTLDEIWKSI